MSKKIDLKVLEAAKNKVLKETDIDTNDLNSVIKILEDTHTTSNDVTYLSYMIKQVARQKGLIK